MGMGKRNGNGNGDRDGGKNICGALNETENGKEPLRVLHDFLLVDNKVLKIGH
jgi:hypothetical protein